MDSSRLRLWFAIWSGKSEFKKILIPKSINMWLFFPDQTALECNIASKVRCLQSSRYLRFVGKLSSAQLDDPCEGREFVSYPGNCENYLRCLHGTLQIASCPDGLHWNTATNNCDWPANAKCKEGGNPVLVETESNEVGGYIPITTPATPTTTKKPRPPVNRPAVKPFSGDFKLVCYFTNWAWCVW